MPCCCVWLLCLYSHRHRSKFTQFLVFFSCGLQPKFVHPYVDLLLMHLFHRNGAIVLKQSSVAYLASYLSRARYVDMQVRSGP